jgi:asparagine synthase (glutamine-hydrolysing)
VTREALRAHLAADAPNHDVAEYSFGGSYATVVTDRRLAHCDVANHTISVVESPLVGVAEYRDLVQSEIHCDLPTGELSVHKPIPSGRPLYVHLSASGEFFCSTHISLLRKAGVPIEEDLQALPEFLIYRFITPPATLFKNIQQLSIGSTLNLKCDNGKCEIQSLSQLDPFLTCSTESRQRTFGDAVEQTHAALAHSIDQLHPCGERLAVPLSGGLDSSILFSVCKQRFGTRQSFSTHYPFEDPAQDREKDYALSAAEWLHAEHRYYESDNSDYLFGMLDAIAIAEEPLHHLQTVMVYLMLKNAVPAELDLVVSGYGADGVYGLGFHNRLYASQSHAWLFSLLGRQPMRSLLNAATQVVGRGRGIVQMADEFARLGRDIDDPDSVVYSLAKYGNEQWVRQYSGASRHQLIQSRQRAVKPFAHRDIYDIVSMLDIVGDVSITQSLWSKLAEGCGKSTVYPFNNGELFDAAFAIDWNEKLAKPKNILRKVAERIHLPARIIDRKKSAFGVHPSRWSGKNGAFAPLAALAAKYFPQDEIERVQSIDSQSAMVYWNIVNYAVWRRLIIDGEPLQKLREELAASIAANRS